MGIGINNEERIKSGIILIIDCVNEKYAKPILFINPKAKVKIDKRKTKKI